MKYGFLFGAGAEYAYKLPSGGKFTLDIFRRDSSGSKEVFKEMRKNVDSIALPNSISQEIVLYRCIVPENAVALNYTDVLHVE